MTIDFGYVDPFTRTRQAIFALLAGHAGLQQCFKAGNRLSVQRKAMRGDKSLLPADFPQLTVLPGDMEVNPYQSNTHAAVAESFTISVESGTLEEDQGLDPIRWQILRAFAAGDAEPPLGLPFVNALRLRSIAPSIDKDDRGKDQWVPVFRVEVQYKFNRTLDLKAATPALNGA